MYKISIVLVFFLFFVISPLHAAEKITIEEYTHILSENETKNEARKICFLEAKQKILKKVADDLDQTEWKGGSKLKRKNIDECLPVLLKIETAEEKWNLLDNRIEISISVKTVADYDYLIKRIRFVNNDKELQQKIQKNQEQLKVLEKEYADLLNQLETADKKAVVPLQKKRQVVSAEIDRLEEVTYLIASKTKLVSEEIVTGMTIDEVISIAGQPRTTVTCEKPDFLNYGNIWVWINNGIVIGKIPIEKWSGPCYRYSTIDKENHLGSEEGESEKTDEMEKPKYAIHLKTGQIIYTSIVYTVNDIIYYKKYGGIIGIEEDKVEEIKEVE